MSKVMLFGSSSIRELDVNTKSYIRGFMEQGCEFIVAGGTGIDEAFHMELSRVGAFDNSFVYKIDGKGTNKYRHNERKLETVYNEESKTATILDKNTQQIIDEIYDVESVESLQKNNKYYQAVDRLMARECTVAICVWDGKSKSESSMMDYLSILNKPCYVNIIPI